MHQNKKPEELSIEEIKGLQADVCHFFTNHPHEKLKSIMWDLYTGWVYSSAEYVTPEEITDMLKFYEDVQGWLCEVHEYAQYLDVVVLKRPKRES